MTPTVVPSTGSSLSDGVVVETVIVARVLGAPLLRLDGTVVLAPGVLVRDQVPSRCVVDQRSPVGSLDEVAARLEETSARQRRVAGG